jgi:adenylylsulfate reductase subunit A
MSMPVTERVDCDVLIVGGGMAGCGAAFEASYWGKGLRVVMVEKAAIERSGAVAQGLSAINMYLGMRWGENTPEDFVRYVRGDLMGVVREDLLFDIARHVDASVHMFEEWGLPIWKTPEGRYVREGRWQIMIHGESYKPIVAEAAKTALGSGGLYERVFVTHLLMDSRDPGRVAGAIGFSVRENKIYVFTARAVIVTCGGATALFRPRSVGEGIGRTWFTIFNTGSTYGMMIEAGAEATNMEHRFVPTRFKDGYGPVGAWFLLFKAAAENALGEDYVAKRADDLKKFGRYGRARPVPTPLRNHQMLQEILEGRGPIYMRTDKAIQKLAEGGDAKKLKELESEAWEDFLDMTISQAVVWAAGNVEPEKVPSEITVTEPYIMGSHSGGSGMWVSGPEDLAPSDYHWGYNRMTTVQGLFTAGDGAGASAHKFSSGSFTEGRIAGKAAVAFVYDHADGPVLDEGAVEAAKERMWRPLTHFENHRGASTREDVNPNYLLPKQGLLRLQKIMDEYVAGASTWYRTSASMLEKGLEHLLVFKEDLESLGARDLHELMRCWELVHRTWTGEAHLRHMLFRQETRWPGYYYRMDHQEIDDENWLCFVNSRFDPATGRWDVFKKPYHQLVPDAAG